MNINVFIDDKTSYTGFLDLNILNISNRIVGFRVGFRGSYTSYAGCVYKNSKRSCMIEFKFETNKNTVKDYICVSEYYNKQFINISFGYNKYTAFEFKESMSEPNDNFENKIVGILKIKDIKEKYIL